MFYCSRDIGIGVLQRQQQLNSDGWSDAVRCFDQWPSTDANTFRAGLCVDRAGSKQRGFKPRRVLRERFQMSANQNTSPKALFRFGPRKQTDGPTSVGRGCGHSGGHVTLPRSAFFGRTYTNHQIAAAGPKRIQVWGRTSDA